MNETFWDAQNLEIESCANSYNFLRSGHFLGTREKIPESEKISRIGCSGLVPLKSSRAATVAPQGPPVSPRPGPPRVPPPRGPLCPPSRADSGPPAGRTSEVKNVLRFKIDAKSIPEALATTILIL